MARNRTRIDWVEGNTAPIVIHLAYANGDPVPKSEIDNIILDLYAIGAPQPTSQWCRVRALERNLPVVTTTINGRDEQEVLDAHNVTMNDTSGEVTWNVQVADAPFLGSDEGIKPQTEIHEARFTFQWGGSPVQQISHIVEMNVTNLRRYSVE